MGISNLLNTVADITNTVREIVRYTDIAINVFLIICGLLIVLFAVYVGWRLAKAEDDSKRKEAKAQLLWSVVGIIALVIVAALLQAVIPNLQSWTHRAVPGDIAGLDQVISAVAEIVSLTLKILASAGIVFALYIAWQLMKAEEDSKRKQAKLQLLYTLIGIVAVVFINVVANLVLAAYLTGGFQTQGL